METKYIKVTPKGETTPRIVLANLKTFYIAQGAKIETPTDEEVFALEPAERQQQVPNAEQNAELARLRKENSELALANAELGSHAADDQMTIADLKSKLTAAEMALGESEKVIENLRKELVKTRSKADNKE